MAHEAQNAKALRPKYLPGPLPIPESTNYVDPREIQRRLQMASALRRQGGQQQPNVNNGTWQGALAHMINKGVGGFGEYQAGQAQQQAVEDQAANTKLRGTEMNSLIQALGQIRENPGGIETPGAYGPQNIGSEPVKAPDTVEQVQIPQFQHPDVQNQALQLEMDRQAQALKGRGTGGTSGVTFGDFEGYTPERRELYGDYQSKGLTALEVGQAEAARQAARTGALPGQEGIKNQYAAARHQNRQNIELSGIAPKGDAQTAVEADRVGELAEAKRKADLSIGRTKAEARLSGRSRQTEFVGNMVDDAISMADEWTTGMIGGAMQFVRGTDAYDLSQTLLTIKANAGFDRLQEMRDTSPTGGALGQVAVQELEALQASWGSLSQSQSKGQFVKRLTQFKELQSESMLRVEDAFKKDYGNGLPGGGGQQSAPEGGLTESENAELRELERALGGG